MSAAGWAAVAALGGAGAVSRHLVDAAVTLRAGRAFPWGILIVNVSGAFALGLLAGAEPGADALRLAGTGFLGAFTTFSTWMLQSRDLIAGGRRRHATLYLLGSLAAGLVAAAVGRALA